MKGWRRCCCCWAAKKKVTVDDGSALVAHDESSSTPSAPFYVPRRHSSYHTGGAFCETPVKHRPHSDSGSSSEGEESEGRGRCYSATPSDLSSNHPASRGNARSVSLQLDAEGIRGGFEPGALAEIAETEAESPPATTPDDGEGAGLIIFSTEYDERDQRLRVMVERAMDLPRKGDLERYSTLVRLGLTCAPRKTSFLLSRSAKDSVYREEHFLHASRDKWKTSKEIVALRLSVFDIDRQGRHDAIGHALLPLSDLGAGPEQHRLPISPRSTLAYGTGVSLGQVLLGLFYTPSQSRLAIHVIRARQLRTPHRLHKESCDTFSKVTLMCAGQKVKTTKSKCHPEPSFDHRSNFVVPAQFLRDSSVLVTVLARGALGRARPLGRVTAGPYTETASGAPTHWGRMLRQDARSVVLWRNLHL